MHSISDASKYLNKSTTSRLTLNKILSFCLFVKKNMGIYNRRNTQMWASNNSMRLLKLSFKAEDEFIESLGQFLTKVSSGERHLHKLWQHDGVGFLIGFTSGFKCRHC